MKYILSISLVLLLWSCQSTVKSDEIILPEFKHIEHLDNLVDTFMLDTLMNSLSIGIYHQGEAFIKHYGELDLGEKNEPNNKTLYDIGSVTKTFVGTLIAEAELEGKLSIEDDVRKYLNGEYPNLAYEDEPIRIRHLITHTSRLPRYLPRRIMEEFNQIDAELPVRISKIELSYSKEQFLIDLKKVTIDTFPGYNYAYSNAGAELASYILERVNGMPFEKLLEEKIWKKANMNSTMIALKESFKASYANGYGDYKNQTPAMNTPLWGGSGHGKSTLPDLLNYIKFHLDKENAVVQKSHQVLFEEEGADGEESNRVGYMWKIHSDSNFGGYIRHHGGAYGVQNWMFIYPEEELGISIATNQSGWHTAGKLLYVVNGILDEMAKEKMK